MKLKKTQESYDQYIRRIESHNLAARYLPMIWDSARALFDGYSLDPYQISPNAQKSIYTNAGNLRKKFYDAAEKLPIVDGITHPGIQSRKYFVGVDFKFQSKGIWYISDLISSVGNLQACPRLNQYLIPRFEIYCRAIDDQAAMESKISEYRRQLTNELESRYNQYGMVIYSDRVDSI